MGLRAASPSNIVVFISFSMPSSPSNHQSVESNHRSPRHLGGELRVNALDPSAVLVEGPFGCLTESSGLTGVM